MVERVSPSYESKNVIVLQWHLTNSHWGAIPLKLKDRAACQVQFGI
jgi:hypothetical protein